MLSIKKWGTKQGFINVSACGASDTCEYITIPIKAGDVISVSNRDTEQNKTIYYVFTKSEIVLGKPYDFATNLAERYACVINKSRTHTASSDTKFLSIMVVSFGVLSYPSALTINGVDLLTDAKETINNTSTEVETLSNTITPLVENSSVLIDNICYNKRNILHNMTLVTDEDGNNHLSINTGTSTLWRWSSYRTKDGYSMQKGHQYLVMIDMLVNSNSLTEGTTSTAGNNAFSCFISPDAITTSESGSKLLNSVVTGTRGYLSHIVQLKESSSINGLRIVTQYGKYTSEDYIDVVIYNTCVIDLGESEYGVWKTEEALGYYQDIQSIGVVDKLVGSNLSLRARVAERANVADSVAKLSVGSDIDIWGDSLTAQGWGNDLARITGRQVYSHGYGSHTSTFIRDEFLAGLNRSRTNIFWVGRNNLGQYDTIVDDIRIMVKALGTQDFIIMTWLNGSYQGEYKGQSGYELLMKGINDIKAIYPDNVVDIRDAIIRGWDCGDVRLLSAFTQPNIGENVTINVSDAVFLTTLNSYDITYIGEDIMNKIVIGISGKYDIYEIVEMVDDTHLTIKLIEANRIQPSDTVDNIKDPDTSVGPSTSIRYLRVQQHGDYYCINTLDTTPSTSRKDRIHQSEKGRLYTAEVIARALAARKI